MSFIDFIRGRKNTELRESDGLNLAIFSIEKFKDRLFTYRGIKKKYSNINETTLRQLLRDEVENTLIVYRYRTKVLEYMDRKGLSQIHITITGKASMMTRYNPLDMKLCIQTVPS